jgi:hypothetical protein
MRSPSISSATADSPALRYLGATMVDTLAKANVLAGAPVLVCGATGRQGQAVARRLLT